MPARSEYRDRDDVEVAILDALVDRQESGMTIFELRSRVDVDIETLEPALANLREDGLITIDYGESRSVIRPKERVVPADPNEEPGDGPGGWVWRRIRERLGR